MEFTRYRAEIEERGMSSHLFVREKIVDKIECLCQIKNKQNLKIVGFKKMSMEINSLKIFK